MKKNIVTSLIIAALALFLNPLNSSAQMIAAQILSKVDDILNAAKDQTLSTTITLIDKAGKTSTREMNLVQKGSDKRLVKFLSPSDQKGIGFLSLPHDNLTVYLPAFGKNGRSHHR